MANVRLKWRSGITENQHTGHGPNTHKLIRKNTYKS